MSDLRAVSFCLSPRALCAVMLLALFLPMPRPVQGKGVPAPALAAPGEIGSRFDPVAAKVMSEAHIPGAVVVVVEGGRVIFSKGYGVADVGSGRPISPQTVVRVASLSKLITTTAVLQLVDRGALDLRQDVNHYLSSFKIEPAFGQPVTLAELLTHTGGFDERYLGTAARREAEQVPLERYLATRMPPRVLPPGEVISYSNHGMALAGYLVQRVSGVSYEDYVRQRIFQPLGMRSSAFHLTPDLATRLAAGYAAGQRVPYDYLNDLPAAGLLTTGEDMARFMTAILQGGRGETARILSEARVREMLGHQFSHHPRLAGRGYGWFERIESGARLLGHEGEIRGFASGMYLLPSQGLGLFVVTNVNTPVLRDALLKSLLATRLPPAPPATGRPLALPVTPLAEVAGTYRGVRYPHSTLDKLALLANLGAEMRLVPAGPGALAVLLPSAPPMIVKEVEPGFFQRVGHFDLASGKGLALHRDSRGTYTFAFIGEFAYERLAWYEPVPVQRTFLAVLTLVFLVAVVVSPWRRRNSRQGSSGATSWLECLVGALNLLLLVGVGLVMARTDSYEFTYGVPVSIELLLLLPFLAVPLAVALPVAAVRSWRATPAGWKLYDSAIVLAGLLVIPFLLYWKLLGFQY
jgi:CubicO group peptidase (beta-lactamase class C family)